VGWLTIRATIKTAITTYQTTATRIAARLQQLDRLQQETTTAHTSSTSPHTHQALALLHQARTPLMTAHAQLLHAADQATHYLAVVDPDNAAGSINGLPAPTPDGPFHGGCQQQGGPPVPPARQPLTDTSRRRTFVYTEQGPDGLQDLLARDDGIIALRLKWMDAGGHAHLRHGEHITDTQLQHRALYGHDPITTTTTDWEHGKRHKYGRHATAFTSNAALVFAEMYIWNSQDCQQKRQNAENSHPPQERFVIRLPAVEVLGPNFRNYIRGWTRTGTRKNPGPIVPTHFPDDTKIVASYQRTSSANEWHLITCYPDPP